MKRPFIIYKKYRGLQKSILNKELSETSTRCPKNCKFNQEVHFSDKNVTVPMCTFGQKPGTPVDTTQLVICSSNKQAKECNTYSPKYPDKASVIALVQEKCQTPEKKRENYPELSVLEWVMDNNLHKIRSHKKLGFFSRILLKVIIKLENTLKFLNKDKIYLIENSKD